MADQPLRVAHILQNLNYGGLQGRVLNLIRELPSVSHVVIFQSENKGPLYSEFSSVSQMEQIVRHRGRTVDYFRRLTRRLRQQSPDVVLAHHFGNHTPVSWAAYLAGVPATYAVSANDPIHYSRSRWKPMVLAHLARPFCAGEVAVSHAVGTILTSRLYLPPRRVRVIANGCPVQEIAKRAASGREARSEATSEFEARVFMAATMSRAKGHPTALKAVKLLRDKGRAVELWLAGGTFREKRREEVESLIDSLRVRDRVKVLGARADVPELMGASDIVIHPTASEGFSNVVLEAMAARIPIIASDIAPCREALDGGRCGLLVPPGDAQALADSIERILDDRALAAKLVEAAFYRVSSEYDVRLMAARYGDLLMKSRRRDPKRVTVSTAA